MVHTDIRLSQLMKIYIDGIPLDLTSKLLSFKTRFSFSLLTHIHMHAKSQSKHAGEGLPATGGKMSRQALLGLVDNLFSYCRKLNLKLPETTWGEYYDDTNYSQQAAENKSEIIKSFTKQANPSIAWDLGANDGRFSRILSEQGIFTVAFDIDEVAVQKNWQQVVKNKERNLLPLLSDLTNPSPGIGWAGKERKSLTERSPVDLVMALALVHHLAIANNVPFDMIARFMADLGRWLIIEFIPKEDSQVQRLLASREDIFKDYHENIFQNRFSQYYEIIQCEKIQDSLRSLYLMRKK